MITEALIVVAGALAGGFVSGLTGFGTGLSALPIWLIVLPPVHAGTLVVICSIAGQLQTFPSIRHTIDWRRATPFIAGGLLGVPIGTWFLMIIAPDTFRFGFGILLAIYCGTMLFTGRDTQMTQGGRTADTAVGFVSGILGGIAGLSGVLPTLWTGLRGWDKSTRRGIFQSFNLSILSFAFAGHAIAGLLTWDIAASSALALPSVFLGVYLGHRIYQRMPDARYNQIVLILLVVAGFAMIIGNFA
jgi:uncharacterized membrane protein YfcA